MRQIILDTETTGLAIAEGHRIIEIGCVEMINRKLTGKHFHHYINAERDSEIGALAVHGITTEFLQDKPLFAAIVDEFIDFISGAELIIHNAPFDVSFINNEFNLLDNTRNPLTHYCQITDSLILARKLHIGQRNSLDALCKRYNIDNSQREYHGALLDAHLLARVYLAMTGGQATLFTITENMDSAGNKFVSTQSTNAKQYDLPILAANADELESHQNRLHQMQEKGKCLWLELEVT
jgi:DNA polymerase-3 subunit epsilon